MSAEENTKKYELHPELGFEMREPEDIEYWLSRTVEERWAALEYRRRKEYGYGDPPPRMEKVFGIVKLKDLK